MTSFARRQLALIGIGLLLGAGRSAWSAALEWATNTQAGFRSAGVVVPATASRREGFNLMSGETIGIAFTNHLADASAVENQIRLIGSGVALGDVDGDGWCDVYLARLEGPNRLYRNLGQWRFVDVTEPAGVACAGQYSTGCVLADLDGDGDVDLLVNSIGGGTRLFLNDGRGSFAERGDAGLSRKGSATSMALSDLDGDGDLDLYVAYYRTTTIRSTGLQVLNVNGRRILRPEDRENYEITPQGMILEHGEVDALYLNDGRGKFAPVSWTGGAFLDNAGQTLKSPPRDWGLSVMLRDINGDGSPDIYVCNDFWSEDRIWINESQGPALSLSKGGPLKFRAFSTLALRDISTFSMGVDFADINRDGFDDFLVLDMLSRDYPRRQRQRSMLGQSTGDRQRIEDRPQVERNTLFLNRGDGTFAEIAQFSGLHASEWSWAAAFMDVDLDGFEDVLITTGHAFDTQDIDTDTRIDAMGPKAVSKPGEKLLFYPRLHLPNVAFRNRGDLTFEECGARWGFDQTGVSHGMALGDLDNDGDLDVVVNNLNAPAAFLRNDAVAPRVAVRLSGRPPNTQGVGARVRLLDATTGGAQTQVIMAGGRYLSGDWPMRTFAAQGLSSSGSNLVLEVNWAAGGRSVVTNVMANRVYEITEPANNPRGAPPRMETPVPPGSRPLFEAFNAFSHAHTDAVFDEFARQPLLTRRLSQLGPGVAWTDLDGDGWEDLLIGTGRGGVFGILRNNAGQRFDSLQGSDILVNAPDDLNGALAVRAGGRLHLILGQANYETASTNLPSAYRFEVVDGNLNSTPPVPGSISSPGPMTIADVDGDGELDLFVGGRAVPGRFPESAVSRLYRSIATKAEQMREWPDLGMLSGALFSDLTGDGRPELIVATDWGPLRIWRNDAGRLESWDPPVRLDSSASGAGRGEGSSSVRDGSPLSRFTGWWNGVATGDFDNDGRLDLIAGNWGCNTPQQEQMIGGWRVYYGDLAGRGTIEFIEAFNDARHKREVPAYDLERLARVMPWVLERFPTAAAFSEASIQQVLGERLAGTKQLVVAWPESTLFLNRGDHFEARPLPTVAQLAPAFGVCVGDADGDGFEDAFLSQNFFGVDESTSRFDAGRGLWLRGDGSGGLIPLSGRESGVILYGEQRGAALADFDADGRVDLAVAQNAAPIKLFRNTGGRTGLRVRLRGPAGNDAGLGAVLRWVGDKPGPAREIRAGSGYWSQDSAVTVLARPEGATRLTVRWPGGKAMESVVPTEAKEVVIEMTGRVEVRGRR